MSPTEPLLPTYLLCWSRGQGVRMDLGFAFEGVADKESMKACLSLPEVLPAARDNLIALSGRAKSPPALTTGSIAFFLQPVFHNGRLVLQC